MLVGRAEESDEHLVVNELCHVVRVKAVRRWVENENSRQDVVKLIATPSYIMPDASDDVDVQEKRTPPDGSNAYESAHGPKHIVRCEARRYEQYRLKFRRNRPPTTRRVHHELHLEGADSAPREAYPLSDREKRGTDACAV